MNEKTYLLAIVSTVLGGFLTHLWNKYKERLIKLRYNIWHSKIGFSIDDPIFGSIRVTYNNIPVNNLYYTQVHIYNESGKDLDKFILNMICDQNSKLIITHGSNRDSVNALNFTEEYNSLLLSNDKNYLPYLHSRRDYQISSFNRNEKIEINCIIINDNIEETPIITLGTDTKGIKLVYRIEPFKVLEQPLISSLIIGLIISLILSALIYFYINIQLLAIILTLATGLSSTLLGALFLKIYNSLIRLLK